MNWKYTTILAIAISGTTSVSMAQSLQRYHIDPAKVFVAGISSGGFAAVQMHVAYSSTFKGVAVYAGGVYWCAGAGGAVTALTDCGGLTLPTNQASYHSTLTASEAYLDEQSSLGTIDPATNLRGQPVYLWSGTQDTLVNPLEMADLTQNTSATAPKFTSTMRSLPSTAGNRPTANSHAARSVARTW